MTAGPNMICITVVCSRNRRGVFAFGASPVLKDPERYKRVCTVTTPLSMRSGHFGYNLKKSGQNGYILWVPDPIAFTTGYQPRTETPVLWGGVEKRIVADDDVSVSQRNSLQIPLWKVLKIRPCNQPCVPHLPSPSCPRMMRPKRRVVRTRPRRP